MVTTKKHHRRFVSFWISPWHPLPWSTQATVFDIPRRKSSLKSPLPLHSYASTVAGKKAKHSALFLRQLLPSGPQATNGECLFVDSAGQYV
jgi:hypothetical protein